MKLFETLSLWSCTVLMVALIAWLSFAGAPRLEPDLLTAPPGPSGLTGGIGPVILNTLVITGCALALAIPVSLSGAVICAAARQRRGKAVSKLAEASARIVEIGLCLPRLLWGLAGAAIFGHFLGLGVSAASGVLTLALLLAPILSCGFLDALSRSAERYGPASRAMGYSDGQMMWHVALPAAMPSFLATVLISSGRAMGDAAALLLTAGIGTRAISHWADSGSTLAVHIYMVAVEIGGGLPTAAASALVLLLLTVALQAPLVLLVGRKDGIA